MAQPLLTAMLAPCPKLRHPPLPMVWPTPTVLAFHSQSPWDRGATPLRGHTASVPLTRAQATTTVQATAPVHTPARWRLHARPLATTSPTVTTPATANGTPTTEAAPSTMATPTTPPHRATST